MGKISFQLLDENWLLLLECELLRLTLPIFLGGGNRTFDFTGAWTGSDVLERGLAVVERVQLF